MIEHYPLIPRLVTPLIAPSVHLLTSISRPEEGGSILLLSGLLTSSQWKHGALGAVGFRLDGDGAETAVREIAPRGNAYVWGEGGRVYLGARGTGAVFLVLGAVPGAEIMRDRQLELCNKLDVGGGYYFVTVAFGREDVFSVLLRPCEHRLRAFLSDVPEGASFFIPTEYYEEPLAVGPWRVAELLTNVCSCEECRRRRGQ